MELGNFCRTFRTVRISVRVSVASTEERGHCTIAPWMRLRRMGFGYLHRADGCESEMSYVKCL
jgi:hypothetical protein